jgi:hypothetical protein
VVIPCSGDRSFLGLVGLRRGAARHCGGRIKPRLRASASRRRPPSGSAQLNLQRAAKPFCGFTPGHCCACFGVCCRERRGDHCLSKLAASSFPQWMKWDVIEASVFAVSPERIPSQFFVVGHGCRRPSWNRRIELPWHVARNQAQYPEDLPGAGHGVDLPMEGAAFLSSGRSRSSRRAAVISSW